MFLRYANAHLVVWITVIASGVLGADVLTQLSRIFVLFLQ